jgi:hypothetical protein
MDSNFNGGLGCFLQRQRRNFKNQQDKQVVLRKEVGNNTNSEDYAISEVEGFVLKVSINCREHIYTVILSRYLRTQMFKDQNLLKCNVEYLSRIIMGEKTERE